MKTKVGMWLSWLVADWPYHNRAGVAWEEKAPDEPCEGGVSPCTRWEE